MFGSTPAYRSESSLARRLPLIVGAYLLMLFAVVAGLIIFPFSGILMGMLFFLVGSFFLVSLMILSATSLVFSVAVLGAIRRRLLGVAPWYATGVASKSEDRRSKDGSAEGRSDLWDRWIDGS